MARDALQDAVARLQREHGIVARDGENAAVIDGRRGAARALEGGALDAAVVLDPPDNPASFDRAFFDRGLMRIADRQGEAPPALLYVRSSLIREPNATGGRTRGAIQMSNLGNNVGFANQLFQYAFLRLYGLRHDADVETPDWVGQKIFDLPGRPIARKLKMRKGDDWSVNDLALWTMERPPIDCDFWGYYQNIPPCWAPHREFLRRVFLPRRDWNAPVKSWLARHRPPGTTLVAIHLRRGDYRAYESSKPWFRTVPEEWYRRWLAAIWPHLENPVLFIASDERASVLPAFAEYAPVTSGDAEIDMPEPRLFADFAILQAADVIAICNSSFSRLAAILAADQQRAFIPSFATETFEPYEPWASDRFWQRFGAPDPRSRSRVPRFLRRFLA